MVTDPDLLESITHGREERNLEYKGLIDWISCRQRLTKCAMGMANIRDGGVIVFGVEEDPPGTFTPVGLSPSQRDSFQQDTTTRYVNSYADPFVQITLRHIPHEGADYVVLQIAEFEEMPVICKRDGAEVRAGAIYTRSRRVNECAEIPGHAEMREIIELATQKGMRAFHGRADNAGYTVAPSVKALYDQELRGV